MSDFKVQFVQGIIPSVTAVLNVDAPAFEAVSDFTKAFMIPAVSVLSTAGIGRSDAAPADTLENVTAKARLTDIDTVQFDDSNTGQAVDCRCGAWLVEYTGPAGGVNEVIVRDVKVFSGTAGTFDSTAIAGISNINDCVAFVFYEGMLNSGAVTAHSARVDIVNDGTNNVVRVTKTNTTDTLNLVVYVVEFIGSNWTVQKVNHTFTAAGVNQDEVISAVTLADTFLISTWQATGNRPDQNNYFVWLAGTTTLRHRITAISGTPVSTTYVISNAQMNVEVVGTDPDGTSSLAAGGAAPESRTVACTAVSDMTAALVLGYAGSDHNTTNNRPSMLNLIHLQDADTIELRRSLNIGGTDYKLQVIDLSGVIGLAVTNVDPIIDGANFDIDGNFGTVVSVTLGGVAQAAVSANSTTITRTATLGALKYGAYDLVVNAGGIVTVPATNINPPATKNFVNLSTLVTSGQRITATPDLAAGDQIEWSNVVGGVLSDVTVHDDGSFGCSPGVTAFDVRVNDGTGWGALATQTVSDQAADVTNIIRRMSADSTRLITFALTNIEHDA